MKQETIDALNATAGRTLDAKELAGIQERIETALHDLEAEDPAAWRDLDDAERSSRAGELAQMRHEAATLKEQQERIASLLEAFPRKPATSSAVMAAARPISSGATRSH